MQLKQDNVEALHREVLSLYDFIYKSDSIDFEHVSVEFEKVNKKVREFTKEDLAEHYKAMEAVQNQIQLIYKLVKSKQAQVSSELSDYTKNKAKLKAYNIKN